MKPGKFKIGDLVRIGFYDSTFIVTLARGKWYNIKSCGIPNSTDTIQNLEFSGVGESQLKLDTPAMSRRLAKEALGL